MVNKIAKELSSHSHDVTIITSSTSVKPSAESDPCGFTVYRLPFFTPRLVTHAGKAIMMRSLGRSLLSPALAPLSFLRLLGILIKIKPDVVNLHYVGDTALYVLLACKILNMKLMVNLHGSDIDRFHNRFFFPRLLTKQTLCRANLVVANSLDILTKATVIEPSIKSKSRVIGNGIDLSDFEKGAKYNHHKEYILNVANFVENKGQDVLIAAFARIHKLYPDIDLIMVGEDNNKNSCIELSQKLGIREVINFMGRIDKEKIPSIMAGASLFVLSSRKEAFGIVILEAMASQKPIVATSVGGVPDIIKSGMNGILVAPDDPEQLAEGILTLLNNKSFADTLAKKAFEDVVNKYMWSKVVSEYINEYNKLIET